MNCSRKIIGLLIRSKRKKKKLTLQQLGNEMDADRQYVWNVENGKINITADTLDKFIKKLGSRHEEFFNSKKII